MRFLAGLNLVELELKRTEIEMEIENWHKPKACGCIASSWNKASSSTSG
jgi:hypothetical protein